MIALNKEQKIARSLHYINEFIGFFAFIPALLCWFITIDSILNENNNEVSFYTCSSILLIIFYGYILRCPYIYKVENYNSEVSLWYWMIVLITNLLTALLFISTDISMMATVPAIPFLFALVGLIAHYNLNNINHVSNNGGHEA